MAFPIIPILCALALYVLHDDEAKPGSIRNSSPQNKKKVKKNNSVEITESPIDDESKTVPDSAPHQPENSVPTDNPPENPPEP